MTPNSALVWLPEITAAGLPVPATRTIDFEWQALVDDYSDAVVGPHFHDVIEAVTKEADALGYPVFVRTDLASAKHGGSEAFRIRESSEVARALARTVEDNEMKFWLGGPTPQAFLVREWLDLDSEFFAFNGLAVAREWRLFATPDEVLWAHFYWRADALWGTDIPEAEWRPLLHQMEEKWFPRSLLVMAKQAAAACASFAPAWSVDFAFDRAGEDWWLIDMAVADESWHPEHDAESPETGRQG